MTAEFLFVLVNVVSDKIGWGERGKEEGILVRLPASR